MNNHITDGEISRNSKRVVMYDYITRVDDFHKCGRCDGKCGVEKCLAVTAQQKKKGRE